MITDPTLSVPSVDDAERAAVALEALGARYVLLFGSVAHGQASSESDIDLVAVFDDLGDYNNRYDLREALIDAAENASGWPVDILVTDRPEWRARIAMRTSIESHIDETKLVLRDLVPSSPIDWKKRIEMPRSDKGEAYRDVGAACSALDRADSLLEPSHKELRSMRAGKDAKWDRQRFERMLDLCAKCHMVVETSIKAYTVGICSQRPRRSARGHTIEKLIDDLPATHQQQFHTVLAPIPASEFSPWREAATYTMEYKFRPVLQRVTPQYVYDMFRGAQRCAELVALAMEKKYGKHDRTDELMAEIQDLDVANAALAMNSDPDFAALTYTRLRLKPHANALTSPSMPVVPAQMQTQPEDWRFKLLDLVKKILRI